MHSQSNLFSFKSNTPKNSAKNWLLLGFLTCVLSACTAPESSDQTVYLTPDFTSQVVNAETANQLTSQIPDEDCSEHIKKVTCISESEKLKYDPNCTPAGVKQEQIDALIKLANDMPSFHKKVFCHLNQIQIQDKIYSAAFATTIRNVDRQLVGTAIGFRSIFLSPHYQQTDFESWKEQLNFGRSTPKDPELKISKEGPFASESSGSKSRFFGYLVHELNHVIDMMNTANDYTDDCEKVPGKDYLERCKIPEHSFGFISWGPTEDIFVQDVSSDTEYPPPAWADKYPVLKNLCFYSCQQTVNPELIPQLYKELNDSDFLTSYSTYSYMEDFAEAATIWAMNKSNIPFVIEVKDANGKTLFNSAEHAKTPSAQNKLKWIENFFSKPGLKYHPLIEPTVSEANSK